ncbi:MAG TPA: hypothetical protein VFM05_13190 [Candidatus Saccharimonadales bacterium]|nr:hypothetical protein [Candidatus Saccharimonadales bacterium]
MASILYKNHLIVLSVEYEPRRFLWKPTATICWRLNRRQHFHILKNLLKCSSSMEAEQMGLEAAQSWIDAEGNIAERIPEFTPAPGPSERPERNY